MLLFGSAEKQSVFQEAARNVVNAVRDRFERPTDTRSNDHVQLRMISILMVAATVTTSEMYTIKSGRPKTLICDVPCEELTDTDTDPAAPTPMYCVQCL